MAGGGRPLFGEQTRFMLLLITPAALLLTLFQVVPIAIGANASFRDWALYNPKKTWVGLHHYEAVLSDPEFLLVVLPNTFIFMILSVAGALAKVEVVEQLGSEILLETRVGEARVTVARVPPETQVAAGDHVRLAVQPGRLHFFDPETAAAIVA